ncbi:nitrate/sulfonate/bicarbonate ABC transporter ATP-binding protein [Paenibacillus sp. N1-5-1-14]|uniref:ABC transporter ATP-binding protein n=1 Tax=Paenibacillus radicibacter TaxID=2972488 RepID=UPI002158B523|nr:nitrate/sulfonate/bicarbonate ABC transporter ATP-binding protein [Paenibacillus radicibacter]MCR8641252.1 nitrate/sulfonate/bicarbonate ABC transporter ATP-binding protein [Paenibacillus radicibacter]
MNANLIELRKIGKHYDMPNVNQVTILEDIQLSITNGEFISILGPSGSGKSTLLRIIAGLVPPSSGAVYYNGNEFVGTNPGVGMVFQSFALFPWLTVLENVKLGLENKPLSEAEKMRKALSIIDRIGLDGFESAYPKELSGGMRQRVGIGRALVMEPDILLMDEPFSALDVLTAENLKRDLLELWTERKIPTKSIIMVTHSIEEAVYMSDRAIVLSRDPARIIADIPITMPHWRDKQEAAFTEHVDRIYSILTNREYKGHEHAQEQKKQIEKVQEVPAGALTGFIELIDDLGNTVDLYKLAEQLSLNLEDFLPIVEAAQMLDFASIQHGDITLTESGSQFANASVLERKDIFKKQVLAHVPMMEKIVWILQSKSNNKMEREFFLEIFEKHFGSEEAGHQLDIMIDWGRYAELLAYDEKAKLLFLE